MINDTFKTIEESELAIFWDEMAQYLPKSIERSALGDEKIFMAFKATYPKIKNYLIIKVLEHLVEREEVGKIPVPEHGWSGRTETEKNSAYNKSKDDTISYLKSEIEALSTNIDKE